MGEKTGSMDDITTSITNFRYCGEINTRKLLCLARARCAELGLSKAVIASETGRSALEAVRVFEGTGTSLIVVTHYPATTWGPKGEILIGLKRKEYAGRLEELLASGAVVVQGTRPFAPPTRSMAGTTRRRKPSLTRRWRCSARGARSPSRWR